MGSGYMWRPLSAGSLSLLPKVQIKVYHAKKNTYIDTIQQSCHLLWVWAQSKWTWKRVKLFWAIKIWSYLWHHVLWANEERAHQACYQHTVEKPASVIIWKCIITGGMGNFHICEGPINTKLYREIFWSNNCFKNPDDIFFCKGELLARQSQTPHWQHHSFEIKDAKLAGLQQHLSPTANIWHFIKWKKKHGGGAKYIQGTWKTFSPKPKSLQMNKQVPHWFLDV